MDLKEKIENKEYTILPESIAIGTVYKILIHGNLDQDGYEIGYLYLPKGSGIKEHFHINDIELYSLIKGTLKVNNIEMDNNICVLNEKHSIDIVPTDTIIRTFKISKKYLENNNYVQSIETFEKVLKKVNKK